MGKVRRRTRRPRRFVAVCAVTDVNGGIEHLVLDQEMAAGRRFGRYSAVCGASVLAAAMTVAESGCCERCRTWRAAQ